MKTGSDIFESAVIFSEGFILRKKRVVVAMSGGVDSSVTAALLKRDGYEVMGVTMRLSEPIEDRASKSCCPQDSFEDARRVAEVIGIPHYVADFRELFRRRVVDNFLTTYAEGRTPNPCIECNRHIKFGAFLRRATELGADYIATGHYARITADSDGQYRLRMGKDRRKDQSYVLYTLPIESLAHILLPLGEYEKTATREMAEEMHLPVAKKPDSQEICFIPKSGYREFLRQNMPESLQCGDIVDTKGNVLGRHEGVPLYTIGQRRGLGIAADYPLYVAGLDIEKNRVIVGGNDDVFAEELTAKDWNWLDASCRYKETIRCTAKIRYQHKAAECVAVQRNNGIVQVRFDAPQRAITPGQAVVLYDGDVVLGGGIIE